MQILLKNKKPILVFQGGTSSSKTYSILQYFILKCMNEWENETIDILRRTGPALTRSVMKDFFDILNSLDMYDEDMHNKSSSSYRIGTNLIRFYSADEEQKMRGLRRDRVYFNEILEFKKIDVMQVMMRTHKEIYMDYNPSDEFSWIYDDVLTRNDVTFHISTYLDNPFRTQKTTEEIERLKLIDPNMWRIYGLGQKGVAQATIFNNWDYAERTFEQFEGQVIYGMDFGFNDPTALVRIKYHKEGIYAEQLLYKTDLTSDMIVNELKKLEIEKKIDKYSTIYADSARPEIIEDIRKAGFNVHPVEKKKDSVLRSINFLKRHKIYLNKESLDLIKEVRGYKWKVDKNDKIIDEPVDVNNHLTDCFRYSIIAFDMGEYTIGFSFG